MTHHCDFCGVDVDAVGDDPCACPSCGVTEYDWQHEFGIDEPWLKPLPLQVIPAETERKQLYSISTGTG